MNISGLIKRIPELIYRKKIKRVLGLNYLPYIIKPIEIINPACIDIGKGFCAKPGVRIEAWTNHNGEVYSPSIKIGDNVLLQNDTHITAIGNIEIGDNVLFGSSVLVSDNNHGNCSMYTDLTIPPRKRNLYSKGSIIIEKNVWIGDKATILGGVHIGEGAVIGANSVVTKNIPSYSIAVGVPARIIKTVNK